MTEVYVVLRYTDGTQNRTLIDTVTGSCNTESVETTLALDSEQLLCYSAGLGHEFRVIEDKEVYLIQQRSFEEALPENEGESPSTFQTKIRITKQ